MQRKRNVTLDGLSTRSAIVWSYRRVRLPCHAAKGLECVFPIWFTQCGVSDSHLPCHAHAMLRPHRSSEGHSTAKHVCLSTAVLCCSLEKNGMVGAWHGHGMASVNQTRPHYINQMGKRHSKPLAAWHGMAGERHAMCESALRVLTGTRSQLSQ